MYKSSDPYIRSKCTLDVRGCIACSPDDATLSVMTLTSDNAIPGAAGAECSGIIHNIIYNNTTRTHIRIHPLFTLLKFLIKPHYARIMYNIIILYIIIASVPVERTRAFTIVQDPSSLSTVFEWLPLLFFSFSLSLSFVFVS